MLLGAKAQCLCSAGYTGTITGCTDIDECNQTQPCAKGAACHNTAGGYTCQCPRGSAGDPYRLVTYCSAGLVFPLKTSLLYFCNSWFFHLSFFREGCSSLRNADSCGDSKPCPDQEICVTDPALGASACICPSGYARNGRGACVDIDECNEPAGDRIPCGTNAVCKNLPGSYECTCPSGFHGNPYSLCEGNCMVFKSFNF